MFRVVKYLPRILHNNSSEKLLQKWSGLISLHQVKNRTVTSSITTTPFPEFDNDGLKSHNDLYRLSIEDPDYFWGTLARSRLQWYEDFGLVKDCNMAKGHIRWFLDGKINAAGIVISV